MKIKFTALLGIIVAAMIVTCAGKNANDTSEELIESGFSVKYSVSENTFIYTRKGSNKRLDYFDSDGTQSIYIEAYIPGNGLTGYGFEYDSWNDPDIRARQMVNNYYSIAIEDLTPFLVPKGYSKTGTTTICGKECDVYSGTLKEKLNISVYKGFDKVNGLQGEIAVWNGITMRTKMDGKITSEVVALSFDIPQEAFGKTTEITWIK